MAAKRAIRIRPMAADDLLHGRRLSGQAGWNQTDADWRRIHALSGGGCFVADGPQGPIGTVAVVPFGAVAWIAMVLVEQPHRGRGVGTALVRRALEHYEALGVPTVCLDATPLGRAMYEKFGFTPEYELVRFAGDVACEAAPRAGKVGPARDADFEDICRLDQEVTGCDRSAFLRALFAEPPADFATCRSGGGLVGFVHARAGRSATQIGPCHAVRPEAGLALLDAASRRTDRVLVDIPCANTAAQSWAAARGLVAQRTLTRMFRGRRPEERREWLWAGSGPEKG